MGNEEVIPSFITNLFYLSNSKIGKIIILSIVLILVNIIIFIVSYIKNKTNNTEKKYPRKAGTPSKEPL